MWGWLWSARTIVRYDEGPTPSRRRVRNRPPAGLDPGRGRLHLLETEPGCPEFGRSDRRLGPSALCVPPSQRDRRTGPPGRRVKRVTPSVVNITTSVVETDPFGGAQEGKGVGSGFVIRSDGIIVTNFHVVEGATNIKVTFPPPDQKSYPARVIGGYSDRDLAVLKLEARDLPVLALGDSKGLELGQRVVAIGYALALEGGPTVTSGIISSLTRTIQVNDPNGPTRTYQDVLQTDAAINPGTPVARWLTWPGTSSASTRREPGRPRTSASPSPSTAPSLSSKGPSPIRTPHSRTSGCRRPASIPASRRS
jgi:Trypsin-like peptidase domain